MTRVLLGPWYGTELDAKGIAAVMPEASSTRLQKLTTKNREQTSVYTIVAGSDSGLIPAMPSIGL